MLRIFFLTNMQPIQLNNLLHQRPIHLSDMSHQHLQFDRGNTSGSRVALPEGRLEGYPNPSRRHPHSPLFPSSSPKKVVGKLLVRP